MTIENLNSWQSLSIKSDIGQHSQFLQCLLEYKLFSIHRGIIIITKNNHPYCHYGYRVFFWHTKAYTKAPLEQLFHLVASLLVTWSISCGNLSHFMTNAVLGSTPHHAYCFLPSLNSWRKAFDFQTALTISRKSYETISRKSYETISRKSDPFCGFAFPLGRGAGTPEWLVNQTELFPIHTNQI